MSNKTVIQTIIEKLEENNNSLSKEYNKSKGQQKQHLWNRMCSITLQIVALKEHLPAEKQMIMDAYNKGFGNGVIYDMPEMMDIKDSETYYNETFKNT